MWPFKKQILEEKEELLPTKGSVDRPTLTIRLDLGNGGYCQVQYKWEETDEGIRLAVAAMDKVSGKAATHAFVDSPHGTTQNIHINEKDEVFQDDKKVGQFINNEFIRATEDEVSELSE